MQPQSEQASIIVTNYKWAPSHMKGWFIRNCPDKYFGSIANTYYALRRKDCHITRSGSEWIVEKNGVRLLSCTPKFLGFGLSGFEIKCERHFKVESTDICVDVGACIGDTTIPMLMKATDGTVFAVEPDPTNLEYLKRNLVGYEHAKIVPKAVWNKKGTVEFHIHSTPTGHSILPDKERKRIVEVEADTLDNLFENISVDFAKIDVQGAEAQVLDGASKFMEHTRKLVVETHGRYNVKNRTWPQVLWLVQKHYGHVKYEHDNGCVYAWK
jgi:FkbM family methyltransferase